MKTWRTLNAGTLLSLYSGVLGKRCCNVGQQLLILCRN